MHAVALKVFHSFFPIPSHHTHPHSLDFKRSLLSNCYHTCIHLRPSSQMTIIIIITLISFHVTKGNAHSTGHEKHTHTENRFEGI